MKTTRIAVSTFFFVNGFLYANWTSRLPELQAFYQVSNALLGTLLFISAAGALLAMPFSGWFITRYGSRQITRWMALLFCCIVPFLPLSPVWLIAGGLFFVLGLTSGTLDVAMNGQAVFVERAWNKPIMSSFHAVFSIGMALGAGSGALFAKFHWSLPAHFGIVAAFGAIAVVWAAFHLINDSPDPAERQQGSGKRFLLPTKAILPLGVVAFCCMTGEGAMADWSAIYMNKVIGKDEFLSALAFGSFAAAMTTGRIFGDYFTMQLGKYRLLVYNSILAICGLALALAIPSEWTTLSGFFLVGLGLATVVPIVYSTAGNTPGVPPSVGIAMATSIGYAGFFIGPPVTGFLADSLGLRVGLCFTLLLFLVMLMLVGSLNRRNR